MLGVCDVSRNKSPVAGLDGVELATVIFAFAPNPVARPATFACAIAPSAIPVSYTHLTLPTKA